MIPGGKIACAAIIGPDNNPILTQKYCAEKQEQEIDTLLFCSLDYFEQKGKNTTGFLGNLQTSDRFQIWGYKTNLKYKIVVFSYHAAVAKDDEMRAVCENLKKILLSVLMDPFYQPFSIITSPKIFEEVKSACNI